METLFGCRRFLCTLCGDVRIYCVSMNDVNLCVCLYFYCLKIPFTAERVLSILYDLCYWQQRGL